jgi:hypothetical protein
MDEIKLPQHIVNRIEPVGGQICADAGSPAASGAPAFVAIAGKLRSSPIAASLAATGRIPKAADDRKLPCQPSRSLSESAAPERSQRGCSHASENMTPVLPLERFPLSPVGAGILEETTYARAVRQNPARGGYEQRT